MRCGLAFPSVFEPSEHDGTGFEATAIFSWNVPMLLLLSHL